MESIGKCEFSFLQFYFLQRTHTFKASRRKSALNWNHIPRVCICKFMKRNPQQHSHCKKLYTHESRPWALIGDLIRRCRAHQADFHKLQIYWHPKANFSFKISYNNNNNNKLICISNACFKIKTIQFSWLLTIHEKIHTTYKHNFKRTNKLRVPCQNQIF